MLFDDQDPLFTEYKNKSRIALRGIKKACMDTKERLYLTNSQDLIRLFFKFNLIEYYPNLSHSSKDGETVLRDTSN